MKLKNEEVNYSVMVVRVHELVETQTLNTLVLFPVHGMQALVGKSDTKIGDIGLLFPTECQISSQFISENNLFRNKVLNKDPQSLKNGYFEDKGRVKAIKFQGNTSNAFFIPLASLEYLGIDINKFKEGDSFTHIGIENDKGETEYVEICRKYVIKQTQISIRKNKTGGTTKKFKRVDVKLFPQHFDTAQYFRNKTGYKDNDWVTCTQKLHGTSARFANQKVLKYKKPTFFSKVKSFFGFSPKEKYEYDCIAGSRKVIKDIKVNDGHNHYYEVDLWNEWLERIKYVIPKNVILYGEIIGWVNKQKEIQKNYSYGLEPGKSDFFVYRITFVNEDGFVLDWSWEQIKQFCHKNGLKYVPELWSGFHKDLKVEDFLNKKYYQEGFECVPVGPKKDIVDEGICIRKEGFEPFVTKCKASIFLEHESKQKNLEEQGKAEVDIESQESNE